MEDYEKGLVHERRLSMTPVSKRIREIPQWLPPKSLVDSYPQCWTNACRRSDSAE